MFCIQNSLLSPVFYHQKDNSYAPHIPIFSAHAPRRNQLWFFAQRAATSPTGRAMWQMVGILAELERSLIQERTKAGRAAAIARGVKMGRKPKLTTQQIEHAKKLLEQGEHHDKVAQLFNVSRRTLYRVLQTRLQI